MSVQSITNALRDERYRVSRLSDSVQKGKDAAQLLTILQREMKHLSELRKHAYLQTMVDYDSTYGDMAAMFGVSKQRLHAIMNGEKSDA